MNVYTPSMAKFLSMGLLAVALALPVAAVQHQGQVKFGGLPLPGATVTATKDELKKVAVTDQQGVYTFNDLADGLWNLQVEMQCFSTINQEIAVAPNAPSPQWEMKLLPFEEIKAQAPPPPPPAPVTTTLAPPAATASAAKPAAKKEDPKKKGKTVTTAQAQAIANQGGFQKTEAKEAGDGAKAPADP